MELIAASSKYKLSPFVLKRFEPNIDNGTMCLYNAQNDVFWTGSYSVYLILNLMDGKNTLEEIKNYFVDFFDLQNNYAAVSLSIDNVLIELIEINMIEKV